MDQIRPFFKVLDSHPGKDHVRFPEDFGLNLKMNFYDYFPFS
jgi:hypothetical protein